MSFSSSHSIAFAKWVISKLPASISDDLVDNIGQTLWDEFLGTDEFKLVSKQNIDAIIPLLVEGITTKPSKPSKSTKPRKPTKIRSDAQTSTEDNDETNNIVIQVGVADDTLPKVKKPRANKKQTQTQQFITANDVDVEPVPMVEGDVAALTEGGEVQQAPQVPEPKVKKPRANKKQMQILPAAEEEGGGAVQQAPAVPEPKVKKPRANKKQMQIVSDAIGDTDDLLLDFNNLNISNNNDDIVVPVQEHLQLEHAREEIDDYNELVEDSYSEDEQQELTECFVDEVLFYTDEHGNWFDQQFQSIANPTI